MTSLYERMIAAHRVVSREIGSEHRKAAPNPMRLSRLKKERLAIKDRLARHIPTNENTLRFVRAFLARLRRGHA